MHRISFLILAPVAYSGCTFSQRAAADLTGDPSGALVAVALATVGTFFGAFFAFRLELRQRQRDKKERERDEGNRILLTLTNQYSILTQVDEQWLAEHRDNPLRWLILKPFDTFHTFLRIDTSHLGFLLDSTSAQITLDILLAEEAFMTLRSLVTHRNDLHLKRIQPLTESLGLEILPRDEAQLQRLLGGQRVQLLKDLTDSIYQTAEASAKTNEAAFLKLRSHLAERYPKKYIVSRAYIPPASSPEEPT